MMHEEEIKRKQKRWQLHSKCRAHECVREGEREKQKRSFFPRFNWDSITLQSVRKDEFCASSPRHTVTTLRRPKTFFSVSFTLLLYPSSGFCLRNAFSSVYLLEGWDSGLFSQTIWGFKSTREAREKKYFRASLGLFCSFFSQAGCVCVYNCKRIE